MTKMRKAFLTTILAGALSFGCAGAAFAVSSHYDWDVTYTADEKMVSTYDQNAMREAIKMMQPGDDLSLDVTVKNQDDRSTEWYMNTEVTKTLEEASRASNGAYTYSLTFNGTDIYRSDSVGGDDSAEGLKEVSLATGTWLYLGSLAPNASGEVTINMALDGESQRNNYMNTLGNLDVQFGVENTPGGDVDRASRIISSDLAQTGDELNFGLEILLIALCAFFAVLTSLSLRKDRKEVTE